LRNIERGMSRQKRIGYPKMRNGTWRRRKWLAMERPYGPAPTMTTSKSTPSGLSPEYLP
jgi:hypothetical protein